MRKIELKIIETDINLIYADGEYTGVEYLKKDINAMLDDLYQSPGNLRSRDELLSELIKRTVSRCYNDRPLEGGPLTPEEINSVTKIVAKSIKKGWFW